MLDLNEFYDELWGGIHCSIIDEDFVLNNKTFIDTVTYDLYRLCEMDGNISINVVRRILVSLLHHIKIFKVKNE